MNRPSVLRDNPAAELLPSGKTPEPYGDTPYLELIEYYAERALVKKRERADKLLLRDMPGLSEARAAVLGARTARLPVYVSVRTEAGGHAAEPEELLACLICLQELGVAAFGLDARTVTAELTAALSELLPYAKTPLFVRLKNADENAYAALLRAGVDFVFADDAQYEAAQRAAQAARPVQHPPRPEDAPLLLCDTSGVYYLEEDFTLSEEIECSLDMAEEILEREDEGEDALCFHIETVDDAHFFGLNTHMMRGAVCILAEGAELLEIALAHYPGRALIDARSDVEEQALAALAAGYGAVIR